PIQVEPVDHVCLRGRLLPHTRGLPRRLATALPRHPELRHAQHSLGVCGNLYVLRLSLCTLCVLCVSVVSELVNHRDTENTEGAQRREVCRWTTKKLLSKT